MMLNGYITTDLQVHNPLLAKELKAAARHHALTVDTVNAQKHPPLLQRLIRRLVTGTSWRMLAPQH